MIGRWLPVGRTERDDANHEGVPSMKSPRRSRVELALAVALALGLGGCLAGPAPSPVSPISSSPLLTTSVDPATERPPSSSPSVAIVECRPADLVFLAGRQGETGVVQVGAAIANLGIVACSVPAVPARIELVRANGTALPLRVEPPIGDPATRVLVPPGAVDGADLIAYWANWSGGTVGPLQLRITFVAGDAAVHAPFDGSLLARCDHPAAPSSIQIDSVIPATP
jgi:hypothetical protein